MKTKLFKLCRFLDQGLIERGEAVRLALLAAISGEHLLLLGKPGTAKSLLARKLRLVFQDSEYFERLLTRFSVPEELFGPLSIKALEEDRYHRQTRHYLPEAHIAFIDEIFKANSAILNALLTLLNEREFDNGSVRVKTPLISVIAASNELPADESLEALYDRFLLRLQVEPVTEQAFDSLLDLSLHTDQATDASTIDTLTNDELKSIQSAAASLELSDEARQLLHGLRTYLLEQDCYISDRRWQKAIKLLQVSAFTHQQTQISEWDCLLLSHSLWHTPEQRVGVESCIYQHLQLNIENTIERIERLVSTWEQQLEDDSQKQVHLTNAEGEYLYQSPEGKSTTQHERVSLAEHNGETLYLAPPDNKDRTNQGKGYTLAELEQAFFDASYKQTHIEGRWVDIQNYINNTQNRLVSRVSFEPQVEPFYFDVEYIQNQKSELASLLEEVKGISHSTYERWQQLEQLCHHHLWLNSRGLEQRLQAFADAHPRLMDYQQRLVQCLKLNSHLRLEPMHSQQANI